MNFRKERLSSTIKEELSIIIAREIEFNGALVTITEVEVSTDSETAIVNFSTIPSNRDTDALKILEQNVGRLHHLLLKKIRIKYVPYLKFKIDKGPEKAAKIEKVLIEEEKKESDNNSDE